MKLSITQIIFGILIMVLACLTALSISQSSMTLTIPDSKDFEKIVEVFPANQTNYNIARYGSWLLLCPGVIIIIVGYFQIKNPAKQRRLLSLSQVILGIITVVAFIFMNNFINHWGYPAEYISIQENLDGSVSILNILIEQEFTIFYHLIPILYLLFGVVVVGVGIAQLVKARKIQNV